MTIKVMTYNICSCHNLKYEYVPDQTMEIIRAENPDIIGINEMDYLNERNDFIDMPKIMAEKLGYNYYFGKSIDYRGGEYGNVIMSRFPIDMESVKNIPVPESNSEERDRTYENRAIIKAPININGRIINVLISHYGLSYGERVAAVSQTIELINSDTPTIFMGDLNCQPDAIELQPLYGKLNDTALSDNMFTIPSDEPNRKIDYIFTSNHFKVESSYVIDTQVSDHCPYVAILS